MNSFLCVIVFFIFIFYTLHTPSTFFISPNNNKMGNVASAALNGYSHLLDVRPLCTRAITASCLAGFGDFFSQVCCIYYFIETY